MAKVLGVFDNPLPAPLNNNYGVFILDLIIWTVIIIGIYLVIEAVLKRWAKKTKTELDDIIFGIIHFPVIALLILYAFITSLRAFDASEIPAWLFALVDDVYFIALVIIGLFLVYRVFKNVVIYYGKIYAKKTKTDIDDVIIPLAEKLGVVIIFVVAIALLLGYLGIDLTMLAVGSIVISMVIAFALQDTLSNFFSGLYLLTDRPFKDGDLIELESGDICRVAHIGMRSTRLYKIFEHTIMIVPNNRLANERIINFLEPDMNFRVKVEVGVAYGSDVKKVRSILEDIVTTNPDVLKGEDKKPIIRFASFGDSSLDFIIYAWVNDVYDRWTVSSDIREEIHRRFEKEGVEIPFPQRVVWHKDKPIRPDK